MAAVFSRMRGGPFISQDDSKRLFGQLGTTFRGVVDAIANYNGKEVRAFEAESKF